MKYIPNSVTRFASRSLLKANANSPTILVVAGVVGMGASAVLAARATRKLDPVIETHNKTRWMIQSAELEQRDEQKQIVRLYTDTSIELAKIYGPALGIGTLSAISILGGHRILRGRQIATMAAYSGLFDQFQSYRNRVAQAFGTDKEQALYEGADLEWVEDPDHKGEYKLEAKFKQKPGNDPEYYLQPFFDEMNANWSRDPQRNFLFLKGVQSHMNDLLEIRGHVFLNEVLDALGMPRVREGQVAGWVRSKDAGANHITDGFVDFGFMSSMDPHVIAFRNGAERSVRLNFNIDGNIYDLI